MSTGSDPQETLTKIDSMKEIKIRPRIEENDLLTKIKNIKRLLNRHEVKVDVIFRGREVVYISTGDQILDRIVDATKDVAKVVSRGRKDNICSMFLSPRR